MILILIEIFWEKVRALFARAPAPVPVPPQPQPAPQNPPVAPVIPPVEPVSKLTAWAHAMQDFEGYIAPNAQYPKGSPAYRCNNPGNLKDIHGAEIVFTNYVTGFAALEVYLERVATGKHPAYPKGGATTLYEFTHIYTGDPEPSPTNYAHSVANKLSVGVDTPISQLL